AGSTVITRNAAIIARRHLHMTPADAAAFGVQHGQSVCVRVMGSRPLILEDVPVRVSEQSSLALHMDTDEANAAGAGKDCTCRIISPGIPIASCPVPDSPATPAASPCELSGKLITDQDIRKLRSSGCTCLKLSRGQIITPLAKDTARDAGITLIYGG
ncbi:MAG: hypothetical protein IJ088_13150, partial [Clostridia bacterium]|nr:hypothetical protein [Clostridia bacterium]